MYMCIYMGGDRAQQEDLRVAKRGGLTNAKAYVYIYIYTYIYIYKYITYVYVYIYRWKQSSTRGSQSCKAR